LQIKEGLGSISGVYARGAMIKPCICGSNQRSKKDKKPVVDRLAIGAGFNVVCQNCGNESPIANYEDEAIYFWNEIIKAYNKPLNQTA
jgi:hypothetical protein